MSLERVAADTLAEIRARGTYRRMRVLDGAQAPRMRVEGREVLVVDGIVDTGRSLAFVMELVRGRRPRSLKTCTLLDKSTRRLVPLVVDYRGFEIEDVFVVGYGMDYDQSYRALRHIAAIE